MASWPLLYDWRSPAAVGTPPAREQAASPPCLEAGDPAVDADAHRVIAWHCHAVIEDASRDLLSSRTRRRV